jgi:hypothetical protein
MIDLDYVEYPKSEYVWPPEVRKWICALRMFFLYYNFLMCTAHARTQINFKMDLDYIEYP